MNKRRRLVAAVLGLGLCWSTPAAFATENLVFTSGAFRRSIPVADLEHLATTGEARGLLGDVLRLGRQNPKDVSKLLNESVQLPIVLMSRLLNTRIGEAILARLARILFPLRAPEAARLVQRGVLLAPERTTCAVSAQAMAAMGAAMVTFTAYGDTLLLSSPQGAPAWRLSLERRSTATRLLGEGMGRLDPGSGDGQEAPDPKGGGLNLFRLF